MPTPLATLRFRRDHAWSRGHFSAFIDGDLSERGRGRLRRHIDACPECQRALMTLEKLVKRLHARSPRRPDGPAADASQAPADAVRLAAAVRHRITQPDPGP